MQLITFETLLNELIQQSIVNVMHDDEVILWESIVLVVIILTHVKDGATLAKL